jgi:hypothetical protein
MTSENNQRARQTDAHRISTAHSRATIAASVAAPRGEEEAREDFATEDEVLDDRANSFGGLRCHEKKRQQAHEARRQREIHETGATSCGISAVTERVRLRAADDEEREHDDLDRGGKCHEAQRLAQSEAARLRIENRDCPRPHAPKRGKFKVGEGEEENECSSDPRRGSGARIRNLERSAKIAGAANSRWQCRALAESWEGYELAHDHRERHQLQKQHTHVKHFMSQRRRHER